MIFKPKLKVFWCSGFLYCLIWRDGQGPLKIEVFEILNHLFSFYLKNQRGRKWECRWVITFLGNREFLTMGIWNLKLHNVVVSSPSTLFLAVGNETSRSFTYERKGHKALKHMKRKRKTVEVWFEMIYKWQGNFSVLCMYAKKQQEN